MKKFLYPILVLLALVGISVGAHYSPTSTASPTFSGPSHAATGLGISSSTYKVPTISGTAATSWLQSYSGNPNGILTAPKGSFIFDVSTPAVWQNTTGSTVWAQVGASSIPGCAWCQTGIDGAVNFDGSSTVLGLVPSSSVYTLTRDIEPSSMIVANGVTIKENGFRIFVKGTLTGTGTARISNDGGSGTGITGGVAPRNATGFIVLGNTATGGNGGTTGGGQVGAGGAPSGTAIAEWTSNGGHAHTVAGVSAGDCGGGGDGQANGGASGGITAVAATHGGTTITAALKARDEGSAPSAYSGGCSGGGGGSSVGTCVAGGGGAGGGWAVVAFHDLSGAITISADGGNGANAGAGTNNCGGGGGGGGGVVTVIYSTAKNATLTTHASAGAFGTGINAGTSGGAGFVGTVFPYNLSGDGT